MRNGARGWGPLPAALRFLGSRGRQGRQDSCPRGRAGGYRPQSDAFGRRSGCRAFEAGRLRRGRVLPAGTQPDRVRPASPGGGETGPPASETPRRRHAAPQPARLPPQPLSQSRQALPGRRSEARPGERSRTRLPHCAEALRRRVRSAGEGRTGPARRMALAVHPRARGRGRRPGRALPPASRAGPAIADGGWGGDRTAAEERRLRDLDTRCHCGRGPPRLAAGLCPGMAFRGWRQLGDAALGPPPVSASGATGAPPQGHRVRRSGLRLVPGAP